MYEDFKKVAESFVCSGCGHRYPSRDKTPFVDPSGRPQVFSDGDKPDAVKVFKSDERRRSCAWCRHFIVNPFYQRCGLNNRQAEATDICARFLAKPDLSAPAGTGNAGGAASRFDALFQSEVPAPAPVAGKAQVPAAPAAPAIRQDVPAAAVAAPSAEPETAKKVAVKPSPEKAVKKPVRKPPAEPEAGTPVRKPPAEAAVKRPVGRPRKQVMP
ncbi:MAG: hypothetical protein WCI17_07690 [bacterium]